MIKSKIPFLIAGILAYLLLCIDVILGFYPTLDLEVGLDLFWQGTCLLLFYSGSALFIEEYLSNQEIFSVERLLIYVVALGGVVALISGMAFLFTYMGAGFIPQPVETVIFQQAIYFLIIYYGLVVMVYFKKLIFVNKSALVIISWRLFFTLLVVSPIFQYLNLDIPDWIIHAFYFLAIISILPLLVKFNWLLLLDIKGKVFSILALLLSSVILYYLTSELKDNNAYNFFFHFDPLRNSFLILLATFVNLYSLISFGALLFNLPISGAISRKESEVNAFRDISKVIQERVEVEEILGVLLDPCMRNTKASSGWVWLKEFNGKPGGIITLKDIGVSQINEFNTVINHQYAIPPSGQDHIYFNSFSVVEPLRKLDSPFKSMAIFYLVSDGKVLGYIGLLKKYRNGFDAYMLNLLSSYIEQVNVVIDNSRLLAERLEGERLKEELEVARRIQQDLLPSEFPSLQGVEIAASSASAREVGGDYYDFFILDEDRTAIVIADVSGKGTSAAFHMAEMKGIFQALAPMGLSPQEFLSRINEAVGNCLDKNLFITLSLIILDTNKRKLQYLRAGHCPAIMLNGKDHSTKLMDEDGIGLGILRNGKMFDSMMKMEEYPMEAGNVLVLYTDGFLEARAEGSNEEYGYERLIKATMEAKDKSARDMADYFNANLNEFSGNQALADDSTLVVLKFS